MKMTDCRKCEHKGNCQYASGRVQRLNEMDFGFIVLDDNGTVINPYEVYDGCEDYEPEYSKRN